LRRSSTWCAVRGIWKAGGTSTYRGTACSSSRCSRGCSPILVGRRVTDATGGYQAYRLRILDDPRIELRQHWLGRYEVETYLFAKTLLCSYRWKEIPIRITYKERGPYTCARPIVDWWGYFRPVLLLRLGLRR
jgi:hypothetical protein